MKQIFVLLGGLYSIDGFVTSSGMFALANDLKMPDTNVRTYPWASYESVATEIIRLGREQPGDKKILVGYSGGGWRATTVANKVLGNQIDLMVLYDPSPSWNMEPIGSNVKKAICYQNSSKMWIPFVGMIGGGILVAKHHNNPPISCVPINQQHLAVQFNRTLHELTIELVKTL